MRHIIRRLTSRTGGLPDVRYEAAGMVGNPHPQSRRKKRTVFLSIVGTRFSGLEQPLDDDVEADEIGDGLGDEGLQASGFASRFTKIPEGKVDWTSLVQTDLADEEGLDDDFENDFGGDDYGDDPEDFADLEDGSDDNFFEDYCDDEESGDDGKVTPVAEDWGDVAYP